MTIQRRDFLAGLIGGLGGGVLATVLHKKKTPEASRAPAVLKKRRELTMVTTWPKNFPGLGTSAERLALRIAQASEDTISIKVYAAGELVPALESFDAVSSGTADLYHGAEYYWQGKHKAFNFFTGVPFGFPPREMNAWLLHGGGQALWDELSARFNLKAIVCANTSLQMGGWFRYPIETPEDLRGLTIRIPGLGGEVMRRLGAAAVTLPGGEIFTSLQSGKIDATEWVGPWNDLALGLYQIAQYYYWPGFHELGAAISAGFNLDVWKSFSRAEQAFIEQACAAENTYTTAEFNYQNARALEVLLNEYDVSLQRYSDSLMTAFKRTSQEVIEEVAAEDSFSQRTYESYRATKDNIAPWSRLVEEAYLQIRR